MTTFQAIFTTPAIICIFFNLFWFFAYKPEYLRQLKLEDLTTWEGKLVTLFVYGFIALPLVVGVSYVLS